MQQQSPRGGEVQPACDSRGQATPGERRIHQTSRQGRRAQIAPTAPTGSGSSAHHHQCRGDQVQEQRSRLPRAQGQAPALDPAATATATTGSPTAGANAGPRGCGDNQRARLQAASPILPAPTAAARPVAPQERSHRGEAPHAVGVLPGSAHHLRHEEGIGLLHSNGNEGG